MLTRLSLQPGERLLVLGASGGVGSFLLQLAAVRPFGRLASIADPELDLGQLVEENLTLHGVLWAPSGQTARALAGLLADGRLTASISRVLPLAQAAQAHRLLEAGHAGGKVVLSVNEYSSPA